MLRTFIIAVLLAACVVAIVALARKKAHVTADAGRPTAIDSAGPRVQIRVGEDSDRGYLRFRIEKVHEHETVDAESPGSQAGGEWTLLDCMLDGKVPVRFTVGIQSDAKPLGREMPFRWGKAMLRTSDRESGAAFAARFAEAFHVDVPPVRPAKPLQPMVFSTAVLGDGLQRSGGSGGGFGGSGGTWMAMKWFPAMAGIDAEVYFNFSIAAGEGEFAEKDEEYRADLVEIWAMALRDGPRGRRTPAEDPNIAAVGPRLGTSQVVAGSEVSSFDFSPDGKCLLYSSRSRGQTNQLWRTSVADVSGKRKMIAQLEGESLAFRCASTDASQVIVSETLPAKAGQVSSNDQTRVWLVDVAAASPRELRGPWGSHGLLESSSPDGRFVVISEYRPLSKGKGAYKALHILDAQSGTTRTVDIKDTHLEVQEWQKSDVGWEIVSLTDSDYEKDLMRKCYIISASTGEYRRDESFDRMSGVPPVRSPDGAAEVVAKGKTELVVRVLATGAERVLKIHPDDQRFVEGGLSWAGNRYVKFWNPDLSLIDSKTMKMSYLEVPRESRVEFSSDFSYAAVSKAGSLAIAPVIVPGE